MKLVYLGAASALILLMPLSTPQSTPAVPELYNQSHAIEADRVEIVYLPNNTCYVEGAADAAESNYKDFVRACLNNRHLRSKISNP